MVFGSNFAVVGPKKFGMKPNRPQSDQLPLATAGHCPAAAACDWEGQPVGWALLGKALLNTIRLNKRLFGNMLWYVVIICGWVLFRFSTHTINKKKISPTYHQPVPQIWVSAHIVWVHHIEKPSPSGWNEMVSIQREISTYVHKAIVDGLSC